MKITNYNYNVTLNNEVKNFFKQKLIKHYARMCLCRNHVCELLKNENKINLFSKMQIGDEYFLSSLLPLTNYIDYAITYDDWDYTEKEKKQISRRI